ncbi:phosphoribosylaminoimidazolesuccinocarboxamide synthase [Vallitalea okinawensis]|uniref:phosphoribosylaminoimidazolesuccinocarboxamide synthase n=1 Tax=Vallitalea okinawensis TaxID=2078660 RepID=UPI000CFA96E2|nr:phosphoribosylaminoimidazolesuccinocarboxamide synthase [Vallitalea okinawensis]
MKKSDLLYEGKAKKVFKTNEEGYLIVSYKDDATAFNGVKKGSIRNKGAINNKMSNFLMKILAKSDIETHYVEELNDRETVVKECEIIPLEVIVRNVAAGSLSKRLGLAEGVRLSMPVIEYCYKDDELGDPMVNRYHIQAMNIATIEELELIEYLAFKINDNLQQVFNRIDIELIDFKIEFGKLKNGNVILADEISPDTCRFWDKHTRMKLDKDRFRRDLGQVEEAYEEVYGRLLKYQEELA